MEEILAQFAISGGMSGIVYFLIWKMLNNKIDRLETSLEKHIDRHEEYEKSLSGKIDEVYKRINSTSDSVHRIEGYMEGLSGKDFRRNNGKGL